MLWKERRGKEGGHKDRSFGGRKYKLYGKVITFSLYEEKF